MNNITKECYEGAGFFPYVKKDGKVYFLVGQRLKKNTDMNKDPTDECEYFGGKPEIKYPNGPTSVGRAETPQETAIAELYEETGGVILDDNWEKRAKILHFFQPFSKKWIWCFLLQVNDAEYDRFVVKDTQLKEWDPVEFKDFTQFTKRKLEDGKGSRKALHGIYLVESTSLSDYIDGFINKCCSSNNNRMADAKEYGKEATRLLLTKISTNTEQKTLPLRGFNLVILEKFHEEISTL